MIPSDRLAHASENPTSIMIGVDTSDRDLLTAPTRNDIMGLTNPMELVYKTELGQLFKGDCLEVLQSLRSGSVPQLLR